MPVDSSKSVSVVIPVFNAGGTLARAVDSCLSQGACVAEIILVDNNSTDGSAAIINQLCGAHPQLISSHKQPVQGASAARNLGVQKASGEWIQFLDADDELLPGKIDRQINLTTKQTDWIMGTGLLRNPDGSERKLRLNPDPWRGVVHGGGLGDMNSSLFARAKLMALGCFREDLVNGEDMDLYVRLLLDGCQWVQDVTPGAIYHNAPGDRLSRKQPAILAQQELARKIKIANHLLAEKPQYYSENEAYYQSAILSGIRRLFTLDIEAGRNTYHNFFPRGIGSIEFDRSVLPGYANFYRIFGFARLERLRVLLRRAWLRFTK